MGRGASTVFHPEPRLIFFAIVTHLRADTYVDMSRRSDRFALPWGMGARPAVDLALAYWAHNKPFEPGSILRPLRTTIRAAHGHRLTNSRDTARGRASPHTAGASLTVAVQPLLRLFAIGLGLIRGRRIPGFIASPRHGSWPRVARHSLHPG